MMAVLRKKLKKNTRNILVKITWFFSMKRMKHLIQLSQVFLLQTAKMGFPQKYLKGQYQ